MKIRIERLTQKNFADYEKLTGVEGDGGCYCAFWHQKWNSVAEWDERKKNSPEINRQIVLDKVLAGFHVGVLAYRGDDLLAWISVGPIIETFWFWKRAVALGEAAKDIAGIACFTLAPKARGQGLQGLIMKELNEYGRGLGWTSIEAYPFESSVLEARGKAVLWPGLTKGYVEAGFEKKGPHWLSQEGWERGLFTRPLI